MQREIGSVTCATACGGGGGSSAILTRQELIEQIAKHDHIAYGHGYAGAYSGDWGNIPSPEHGVCVWPSVRESERGKVTLWMEIKLSIAQRLWNIIGVDYLGLRRLLPRLLRHR